MAKYLTNIHAYGDVTNAVWTAPLGTTAPTVPLPTAIGVGWYELGWIDDGGVTATPSTSETKKYVWQGASLARILRTQNEYAYTFNAAEENAAVIGLQWPGRTATVVGTPTAEVQTITITGTPTGGTFTITYNGVNVTSAYNVPTATLAASLLAAFGFVVTVTGTPASSYVLTTPLNMGNIQNFSVTNALTGGSSPNAAIVNTTPGVTPTYSQPFGPYTAVNYRAFTIDAVDGNTHHRIYIPNGEAVATGAVSYKADDLTVREFSLNCYPDAAGNWGYDLHDNNLAAPGLFA